MWGALIIPFVVINSVMYDLWQYSIGYMSCGAAERTIPEEIQTFSVTAFLRIPRMGKARLQDPLLFSVAVSKLPPARHRNSGPIHT